MNRWTQFNAIINDEDLSKDAKLLLLTIFRYINYETGYCTASTDTLMKKSRIGNRNTFTKSRYELVMKGWIQYNSIRGKDQLTSSQKVQKWTIYQISTVQRSILLNQM